jgi:hypothetical protein
MSVSKPTIAKANHIQTDRTINGKPSCVKQHQVVVYNHRKKVITDVMTPAPNENALTSGTQIKYFIENNAVQEIATLTLRFQVRMDGGNAKLAPTPYWFDRVEIYDRHTGQELARYYDDALHFMVNTVEQDTSEQWAKLANYDPDSLKQSTKEQVQGETRYYYLPMVASIFEGAGLDMSVVRNDIEIRFHPRDPRISGAGTPALTEVASLISVEQEDSSSRQAKARFYGKCVSSHNFLNTQQFSNVAQTLNAGTKYSFDLDQFDHTSGALIVAIRPTGSNNTDNARQAYMNLYDGTVDVVGTSGVSIYAGGRPVDNEYLSRVEAPRCVGSQYFRKISVVPIMWGNLAKGLHGSIDGYNRFVGDKNRFEFTTPQAGTAGEIAYTFTSAPANGQVRIGWRDSQTTLAVQFNTTAQNYSDIMNSLPSVIEDDLEFNFDVPFLGNTVSTATITRRSTGQPVHFDRRNALIATRNTLEDAGTNEVIANIQSFPVVDAVEGWVNGSYDVDIYSLYFRTLHQDQGRIAVEDV